MKSSTSPRLTHEELAAFEVGIEAAAQLNRHFPTFFAEQAAGAEASPARMLGCAVALFQLVEETYGLQLRWPEDEAGEIPRGDTAAESVLLFDDVSVEFMTDVGYYLQQIRPVYYGDGVNLLIDEGHDTDCPLRLALYWLFQHTRYGLGLNVEALIDGSTHENLILCLNPLPADVAVAELCTAAAAHIPEAAGLPRPGDLIRYAFGRTDNPLADTGGYEIYAAMMGEDADYWPWEGADFEALALLQSEAAQIEEAFEAWAGRIERERGGGVELLAELLHREARTLRRRDRRAGKAAKTLVGSLVGSPLAEPLDLNTLTEVA